MAQYRWKLWSFFLCSAEAALVRNFEMCRAYVLMAFPNLLLLQLCCHSATGCILALSHCQILWALLLYSHLKLQNSKLERFFISKKFKKIRRVSLLKVNSSTNRRSKSSGKIFSIFVEFSFPQNSWWIMCILMYTGIMLVEKYFPLYCRWIDG